MITYQQAGVSIDAGDELVRRIKKIVSKSKLSANSIGGFAGLYPLPKKSGRLFLSGCCDGVGTKLKLAFLLDRHDTVGIDLVAMNVNDLICQGATPLFLDYFACGKLNVDQAEQVIAGIHKGCEEAQCALLGGETAEMPGFYAAGEYDLAGFATGIVEEKNALPKKNVRPGDILIGLPSSGPHSNGYSLIRKVFSESELREHGKELLAPTRIYVRQIMALLNHKNRKMSQSVKAIAHITGGGWTENIPRVIPKGLQVRMKKGSWPVPEIFSRIQKAGDIAEAEMFRTFNMGIGLVLVVEPSEAGAVRKFLKEGFVIGEMERGTRGVFFA